MEREQFILSAIEKTGFVSVEEMATKLHVSPSSVRRTLTELEQKKRLRRVYGGAILLENATNNTPYEVRRTRNVEQKKSAAQSAASLLRDSMSVMLDGSTTCMHMLPHIKKHRNMKLFTNHIHTFVAATEMGIESYCIGGTSFADISSLSGSIAEETAEKLYPDILFFSAKAISEQGDVTDSLEGETRLRRIMLRNARCKVLLCDTGKLNQTSLYKICNLSDIDYVFCENGALAKK